MSNMNPTKNHELNFNFNYNFTIMNVNLTSVLIMTLIF
jgi:hypothetical protein